MPPHNMNTKHIHITPTKLALFLYPAVASLVWQVHPSQLPLGCMVYLLSSPSGPRKVTSRPDHLEKFLTQTSERLDYLPDPISLAESLPASVSFAVILKVVRML